MPHPTFFFINKTATSTKLTRSGSGETTAIQQFVQKGRKRPRNNKLIVQPFSKTDYQSHALTRKTRGHDVIEQIGLYLEPEYEHLSDEEGSSVIQSDEAHIKKERSPRSTPLYRPVSALADPFRITCVTVDNDMHSLIDYYTTIYHPTLWPNETVALRRGAYVFEEDVHQVVVSALQDNLTMYSLLAASACRLKYVDRLTSVVRSGGENEYMARSLRLVYARIADAMNDPSADPLQLANAIIFLSASEAYRDNFRASRLHLNAIVDLLALHNMSVKDISRKNFQGMMFMSDLFLGCVNLEKCHFSSDMYDPGPAEVLHLSEAELYPVPEELAQMSAGFLAEQSQSDAVMDAISKIKEAYTIKMCLNTSAMSSDRALATTHWITKRCMAIRSDLLSIFSPTREGTSEVTASEHPSVLLDKAVRTALVQFTLLSMNITGRVKTVKIMAVHLQNILQNLYDNQSALSIRHRDSTLFFWLLTIGFSCALDNSSTEAWFADMWVEYVRAHFFLDYANWDIEEKTLLQQIESIQHRFFYHAPVQRTRLESLVSRCCTARSLA